MTHRGILHPLTGIVDDVGRIQSAGARENGLSVLMNMEARATIVMLDKTKVDCNHLS